MDFKEKLNNRERGMNEAANYAIYIERVIAVTWVEKNEILISRNSYKFFMKNQLQLIVLQNRKGNLKKRKLIMKMVVYLHQNQSNDKILLRYTTMI